MPCYKLVVCLNERTERDFCKVVIRVNILGTLHLDGVEVVAVLDKQFDCTVTHFNLPVSSIATPFLVTKVLVDNDIEHITKSLRYRIVSTILLSHVFQFDKQFR